MHRPTALASIVSGLLAAASAPAAAASHRSQDPVATSARELIDRSVAAMTGSAVVVTSIRRTAKVLGYHLADRDHVGAPYAPDIGDAVITDDLAGRRIRSSKVSSATGTTFESSSVTVGWDQVTTIRQDGKIVATRGAPARPLWELDQPFGALRLARAAADLRIAGDGVVHDVPTTVVAFSVNGMPVRLNIGKANLLPLRADAVVAMPSEIAWSSRGDLVERFEWQNWTMTRGVRLPQQTDVLLNGEPMETVSVTEFKLNPEINPVEFTPDPDGLRQLSNPGTRDVDELPLGRPDRPIAEIAPGVVQIPGPWYATLVRQADGVVVIDAPISNGYSSRVLEEVARRFPGVPVKGVVSTTGFNWHMAGLREYAARGIPIYLLDRNMGVVNALLTAPHTLRPDALSSSRRHPRLVTVHDHLSLGTGANRLELYALTRSNSPMMITYLPGRRLLHTAEAVQPLGQRGSFLFPESLRELSDEVAVRGLGVDRIIGMHMRPTRWTSVAAAIDADARGLPPPEPVPSGSELAPGGAAQ